MNDGSGDDQIIEAVINAVLLAREEWLRRCGASDAGLGEATFYNFQPPPVEPVTHPIQWCNKIAGDIEGWPVIHELIAKSPLGPDVENMPEGFSDEDLPEELDACVVDFCFAAFDWFDRKARQKDLPMARAERVIAMVAADMASMTWNGELLDAALSRFDPLTEVFQDVPGYELDALICNVLPLSRDCFDGKGDSAYRKLTALEGETGTLASWHWSGSTWSALIRLLLVQNAGIVENSMMPGEREPECIFAQAPRYIDEVTRLTDNATENMAIAQCELQAKSYMLRFSILFGDQASPGTLRERFQTLRDRFDNCEAIAFLQACMETDYTQAQSVTGIEENGFTQGPPEAVRSLHDIAGEFPEQPLFRQFLAMAIYHYIDDLARRGGEEEEFEEVFWYLDFWTTRFPCEQEVNVCIARAMLNVFVCALQCHNDLEWAERAVLRVRNLIEFHPYGSRELASLEMHMLGVLVTEDERQGHVLGSQSHGLRWIGLQKALPEDEIDDYIASFLQEFGPEQYDA